ncbi:MAG TPA: hypothetical protein PKA49_13940 [Tepidiformaceae bacterium]|nr:hypothetical protein [Thermoflexaceae bacterium]HMS59941.1 hypothetical protein [Tepidiformaceae bacterium]
MDTAGHHLEPQWRRKFAEGKMFERVHCLRCRARFNFGQQSRATRVARCPSCGSYETVHEAA